MEVIPETAVASTLVQHPSLTLILVSFASMSSKVRERVAGGAVLCYELGTIPGV